MGRRIKTILYPLFSILAVAGFFRLYGLESVPPGFQFDEAYNGIDALRVVRGWRPIFLEANGGREVLYTYLQALFIWLFGANVFALRAASAILGLATVALTYPLVRALFQAPSFPPPACGRTEGGEREARLVASLTAALCAISYWHVHFSRYGIRGALLPVLEIGCFYFLWRGMREGKLLHFAASGLLLGLFPYSHPAGRLGPLVVAGFMLYKLLADRQQARNAAHTLKGVALTALVSVIIFAPLGYYFWLHRESFLGHLEAVSAFNPQVSGGNPLGTIASNALAVAGMFTFRGDEALTHNLAGRPVFDPLISFFFMVGVAVSFISLRRGRREAHVFIWIWTFVMLFPSVFSHAAPNFSRTIGIVPAVFVFPALGLAWCAHLLGRWRHLPLGFLLLVLTISAGWTWRDYFTVFPARPELYHLYDVDKIDLLDYLRRASSEEHVYLTPVLAEHATITLLGRDIPFKSFDTGRTLVLPSNSEGKGALYIFSDVQPSYIIAFAERLKGAAQRESLPNRYGQPWWTLFRIPAQTLPDPSRPIESLQENNFPLLPQRELFPGLKPQAIEFEGHFGERIKLLGYSLEREEVPAGRPLKLTLFWQAEGRVRGDYTVFVHILDERGRRWGQQDTRPNDGGYPTNVWGQGEMVIDRYQPGVNPCAPPGEYWIVAGMYSFPGGQRLKVTQTGLDFAALGRFRVEEARDMALPPEISPQVRLDVDLPDGLRLLGYDCSPLSPRLRGEEGRVGPGETLGMTFYWEAQKEWGMENGGLRIELRRAGSLGFKSQESWPLGTVGPAKPIPRGGQSCRHYDLTIPLEIPPGEYELAMGGVSLGTLTIRAMSRTFTPPQPRYPAQIRAGEEILFLGCDITEKISPGEPLKFTLYWKALSPISSDYTAFTHLLDAEGRAVAGKDNRPAGGTRPTTGWLPGEVVADEYEIALPLDMPPGDYRLEIGLYESFTGQRLPLFTEDGGQLTDNRFLLQPVIKVEGR
ncbi:MAG: hypothetical protein ACUVV0_02710 [Anaerolineae bacterium]